MSVDGLDVNGWEGCVQATGEINEKKILVGRSRNVGRIKWRELASFQRLNMSVCLSVAISCRGSTHISRPEVKTIFQTTRIS